MTTEITTDLIKEVAKRATRLHSAEEVDTAIQRMGQAINQDLGDHNPVVLCVMIGGLVPMGRLLTRLDFPLQVDYVHATRYQEKMVGEELEWLVRPRVSLEGRSVLVVDDILDAGVTLKKIVEYCYAQGAKMVKTAVLVEKKVTREKNAILKADYTGMTVEDRFVFGYGMDYKRYLRNGPGIYAVAKEDEK